MKNPILIGQAKEIPRMGVNQVWVDDNGTVGLIVQECPNHFLVQISEKHIEVVPRTAQDLFEKTVTFLGEL